MKRRLNILVVLLLVLIPLTSKSQNAIIRDKDTLYLFTPGVVKDINSELLEKDWQEVLIEGYESENDYLYTRIDLLTKLNMEYNEGLIKSDTVYYQLKAESDKLYLENKRLNRDVKKLKNKNIKIISGGSILILLALLL